MKSEQTAREQQLLAALMPLYEAAQSWHNFHHGSDHIRCDAICKALPLAWSAITGAELPTEPPRTTLRIVAAPKEIPSE
jgi:negative regulator of sigma E activity